MRAFRTLWTAAMAITATAALGAETKGPPPTWPWPGPTPPEIRKSLMTERIWQPSDQELKQMEAVAPDKAPASPAKPRRLLLWGRLWTHQLGQAYGRGRVFYCSL